MRTAELPAPRVEDDENDDGEEGERDFSPYGRALHRQGSEDGGDAEHEQDIRHVAADDVAEGDVRVTPQRGQDIDHEFRQGCAEGDHRQADQERRHAELPGERRSSLDQGVRALEEKKDPEGEEKRRDHAGILAYPLRRPIDLTVSFGP